jgi:hypothetical protein
MSIFKTARAHTFEARMKRARNEGYARGAREAKLFKLAVRKDFERGQALGWLQTIVEEGRGELEAQHALEREIEAWDMSCRIAFLVKIA